MMACYDDMGGEVSEGGLRRQENKNPTLRMLVTDLVRICVLARDREDPQTVRVKLPH